ncbi:hypothetical protein JCM10213v2_004943 [Rhodosporidiobolus nylandii]
MSGQLHIVTAWPHVSAFEFSPSSPPSTSLVLFVGGLSDSLGSVPYLARLASGLAEKGWGLAQASLRSTANGWGGATVEDDAKELAEVVKYFRERGRERVVLMGHSTGTQDAIAYLHLRQSSSFPSLDAVILQAPVSDREIVETDLPRILPDKLPPSSSPQDYVPHSFSKEWPLRGGITFQRYKSLCAKPSSDEIDLSVSEDFFSSDLSDSRLANVFRPLQCPLLAVLSGEDSTYPSHVKAGLPALLERFQAAIPGGGKWWSDESGIINGAAHDCAGHQDELVAKVVRFVAAL